MSPEVIVDKSLEDFEKSGGRSLKITVEESFSRAKNLGFSPPTKVVLSMGLPGSTIASKESSDVVHIRLDPTTLLLDNKNTKEQILMHHITHELCHASISEMGLSDIVHYSIFKGKFVDEYSSEEFNHMLKTLKENVNVDSRICNDKILRNGFLIANLYEAMELFNRHFKKAKKKRLLKLDYDRFRLIIEILHMASVAMYLKRSGIAVGIERDTINKITSLYYCNLLQNTNDLSLNKKLQEIYNSLLKYCHDRDLNKLHKIDNILKDLWEKRTDIPLN